MFVNKSSRLAAVWTFSPLFVRKTAHDKNLATRRAVESNIITSPIFKMAKSALV
jgi:hypothetical protein